MAPAVIVDFAASFAAVAEAWLSRTRLRNAAGARVGALATGRSFAPSALEPDGRQLLKSKFPLSQATLRNARGTKSDSFALLEAVCSRESAKSNQNPGEEFLESFSTGALRFNLHYIMSQWGEMLRLWTPGHASIYCIKASVFVGEPS